MFRCIVIGRSFTLARKGYDNHHCHKPQDGKWAGVWMTSCPEEMRLRIWGFWKEAVEIEPWRQRVEFLPLRHWIEFSTVEACGWVFRISTDRDLRHHKSKSKRNVVITRSFWLPSHRLYSHQDLVRKHQGFLKTLRNRVYSSSILTFLCSFKFVLTALSGARSFETDLFGL